ncbi:MAG: Hpt domain-containing protein [Terriglobia bacterium]
MIFDRSAFLSRLEGDEALGSEIIEIFLREWPKLLQGIRWADERHDPFLLERAAHALKGSLGDISAPRAFEAARTLEQMGRAGNLEGSGKALTRLEVALQQLDDELRHLENKAGS